MKLAFVTDSGCGVAPSLMKEKGIYSLSLQIEYDGISYDEYETISYSKVIENLHNQVLMKTSLPRLATIQDVFEEIKNDGYDGVFCVSICSGLSGTLNAMEMMANQVGLQFYGVDCFVTAVVQRRMIEIAKEMYDAGNDVEVIIERLNKIVDSCHTLLLCDDLQHMKRGGRLTPMAATLGGLLKIKPILYINKDTGGKVDVMDKVRTMTKAQDKVINYLIEKGVTSDYKLIVAHVDALGEAKKYASKIEEKIGGSVEVIDLVSAVGIHTGLGCLALQVFKESE